MRLAVFGGTFDPIHMAHTRVAREAADRFALDRVLFVPAAHPPHKPAGQTTPFEHRYHMVELACREDPRFEASRLEEGQEKSYTIHTLERLKRTLAPDDELFFLIGADAFAEIGSWHRSRDVIAMVDFIVVSRPGYELCIPEGARVHRLETLALPLSSSEIRRQLESTGEAEGLHPEVLAYIRRHGLYRQAGPGTRSITME
ncbi:MAG: nicotinate-nucleotide adenylyltransferase [Bryobacteraceae bacterium]|nr:nicotinate-nucleotide adenylyltransferase [Bryobacteraceae bacterium]